MWMCLCIHVIFASFYRETRFNVFESILVYLISQCNFQNTKEMFSSTDASKIVYALEAPKIDSHFDKPIFVYLTA